MNLFSGTRGTWRENRCGQKKKKSWILTVILVSLTSLICLLAGETEPGGCGARQEGSSKLSSVSKLASIIISLSPPPASLLWESLALSSLSFPTRVEAAFSLTSHRSSEWRGVALQGGEGEGGVGGEEEEEERGCRGVGGVVGGGCGSVTRSSLRFSCCCRTSFKVEGCEGMDALKGVGGL